MTNNSATEHANWRDAKGDQSWINVRLIYGRFM